MNIMPLKQVHIWLLQKSRMLWKIVFVWECRRIVFQIYTSVVYTYISSIKIFVAKVWNHQSNIVSCLSNIITVCPPMMPSTPFSDDLLTNQNLCRSAKESLEDDHNKMVVDKDQLPEDKSDTTILCIPVPMHAVVKCKF